MSDIVSEAHRRIQELEAELEELRNFLQVADRLSGTAPARPRAAGRAARPRAGAEGGEVGGASPREIVSALLEILSDERETLDRGTLIERLAARGIKVPGIYANKNLATILWRNQRLFEHVAGEGYRWTGVDPDGTSK